LGVLDEAACGQNSYLYPDHCLADMTNSVKETKFDTFDWIDLISPTKEEIQEITALHKLNFYLVSDSMEPGHLPKIEQHDGFTFIILRAYTARLEDNVTTVHELSGKVAFFIRDGLLITVHRSSFPFLLDIKDTLASSTDIHQLIVHIFGHIVESYAEPASWHASHIDEVEKIIFLKNLKRVSQEDLYYQKAELRISRKLLLLTQAVLNQYTIQPEHQTALQDVKDLLVRLLLEYEEALDDSSSLMNTYLSLTAQKSNDVMKLLTIFSAFFLPLTFIAGVYGMNFEVMPELRWHYGYLFVVLLMAAISLITYFWFRRRRIL
jgi:magnesium transporter